LSAVTVAAEHYSLLPSPDAEKILPTLFDIDTLAFSRFHYPLSLFSITPPIIRRHPAFDIIFAFTPPSPLLFRCRQPSSR